MDVSLVIPGRNAEATLRPCLDSVVPLLASGALSEILFVDDGSTDGSAAIARSYPVRVLEGAGAGPGAARNRGWRATDSELVWFIDSDCVAEPEALETLRRRLDSPRVAGAGGSYSNLIPHGARGAWLARAVHAEIVARHRQMADRVDFLGSFNVLYRRAVLEEVGGFDEQSFNAPAHPEPRMPSSPTGCTLRVSSSPSTFARGSATITRPRSGATSRPSVGTASGGFCSTLTTRAGRVATPTAARSTISSRLWRCWRWARFRLWRGQGGAGRLRCCSACSPSPSCR